MTATLHYFHDPMCSWCYAFGRAWSALQERLPAGMAVSRWLGGLAPDTEEAMPADMREYLQAGWRRIESAVPGVHFNFEFWERCRPRRSTYPSCRAVIAARAQGEDYDRAMTQAIQRAYYEQARNPSDDDTLIALAGDLELDVDRFRDTLNAPETQAQLNREVDTARALGVAGFPSLILQSDAGYRPIPVDYREVARMLDAIDGALR